MRVVITGAAGFIGSHLSSALLDRGNDLGRQERKRQPGPDEALTDVQRDGLKAQMVGE